MERKNEGKKRTPLLSIGSSFSIYILIEVKEVELDLNRLICLVPCDLARSELGSERLGL